MKIKLSILIIIAMMMAVVAGCAPAETDPDDPTTTTTTAADTDTPDDETDVTDETTEPGMEGPSWTWDTSPVTIDWYVHEGWYDKNWDADNVVTDAYITELTGVTVNVTSGGEDERLNAMIASDNLPDVVTLGWYFEQWPLMQTSGLLQPLMPLIDEHAPTFKDILPDSLVGWFTYDDGNLYGIPSFFWAEEHITEDNYLETNDGIHVREDIMNQLDIRREDFNTVEGALDAFRAVRDAELVYDGHRVIPVNLGIEGGVGGGAIRILSNFFGIPPEDSEGNLIERQYDERFLEVLRFMNTIYREDLMSLDNFTMDRSHVEEQWASGAAFVLIDQISDYKAQSQTLFNNDPDARVIGAGPIRLESEDQPVHLNTRAMSGWTVSAIAHDAQDVDRIIRFFEYSYSDEGQVSHAYGVEGVTYEWEDGYIENTDEYNQALDEDSSAAAARYGHNNFWWFFNPPYHQLITRPPERPDSRITYDYDRYFAEYAFYDMAFSDLAPRGGTDEAALASEIDVYWSEQLPRMIMANSEAEMEAIWRDAVDTVYAMGYESVYEVRNERFQMLKDRLDQDFAWPGNQ